MDHIRKIVQLSGNPTWQVNLRKYGLGRPQFETKEAAEAALADAIKKRGAGLNPGRRDVTFAEQAEAFLANAADALAEPTLRSYRGLLKVHILPRFSTRRVIDINTPMIKAFLTEKRTATQKRPEKEARAQRKLSATTIRLIRATLSVVFASAVDDRIIDLNPVAAARSSQRGRKAKAASLVAVPKERPFSQEQVDALLSWCSERDPELHDFVFTLLRLGLRPGEARALRWGDIVGNKVLIERSATDRNQITLTKTGQSRSVDLSPALKDVLRLRQLKRGAADGDYIFGNGQPLDASWVTKRFERALRECGITGHTLYDTRHTFASVLYARCRDVVYTARMLGHSSPTTTLQYYAHFVAGTDRAYVDLLDTPEDEAEAREIGSDLAVVAKTTPRPSENAA